LLLARAEDSAALPLPQPALRGNRGPARLAFSPDGRRVFVTEADEGDVAVVNASTFQVERRLPAGGEGPEGLAVSGDGRTLLVTNTFSGSLALLDLEAGRPRDTVPLRGMPSDVVSSPDGKTAYVSLAQLDVLAVVDLPTAKERARVPVGRRPRALALTPDGSTLVCANMTGGSLSLIDTASLQEVKRVDLGGVNVRGLALYAKGQSVYATLQPPLNFQAASYPIDVWHNFIREVELAPPGPRLGEEQWLDFGRTGSADPDGIAITPDGRFAYLAISGRHTLAEVSVHDSRRQVPVIWPFSFREVPVGANPRGVALTPDGRRAWVANRLGNSLSVVETATMSVVRTVDMGKASHVDPALYGRFLFSSAHLGKDGRFTCNSCHPDGAADGLTWRFSHVPDGLTQRNTRDLRGGILETAPFRWTGYTNRIEDFIQEEVTGLLQGPRLADRDVEALRAALASFRLPANPYRAEDGELTPAARRGQLLFAGKAGCGGCHSGPRLGGTGGKAWVGTTPPEVTLDIPHLAGCYDSAPYLHDGSAATLEEVFTRRNAAQKHGSAHLLSTDQLADLLAFVRQQ
jgi:YVTN family beta-propeller protein